MVLYCYVSSCTARAIQNFKLCCLVSQNIPLPAAARPEWAATAIPNKSINTSHNIFLSEGHQWFTLHKLVSSHCSEEIQPPWLPEEKGLSLLNFAPQYIYGPICMGLIGPVTFAVGLIRRSHQCLHNHQWCWRNRQPTWIQETIEKIKCFFCPCRLPLLKKVVAPAIDEHEIFLQFLSPVTTTSNRASDSAAVEQRLIFCLGCRDS